MKELSYFLFNLGDTGTVTLPDGLITNGLKTLMGCALYSASFRNLNTSCCSNRRRFVSNSCLSTAKCSFLRRFCISYFSRSWRRCSLSKWKGSGSVGGFAVGIGTNGSFRSTVAGFALNSLHSGTTLGCRKQMCIQNPQTTFPYLRRMVCSTLNCWPNYAWNRPISCRSPWATVSPKTLEPSSLHLESAMHSYQWNGWNSLKSCRSYFLNVLVFFSLHHFVPLLKAEGHEHSSLQWLLMLLGHGCWRLSGHLGSSRFWRRAGMECDLWRRWHNLRKKKPLFHWCWRKWTRLNYFLRRHLSNVEWLQDGKGSLFNWYWRLKWAVQHFLVDR